MTPAMARVPNVTARPSVAYLYVICVLLVAGTVSWRRGVSSRPEDSTCQL